MPVKYYFLNKPVLCIQQATCASRSGEYPKFGEIYSVRDVIMADGLIVGFLLHEISATFGSDMETYFPKSSFVVVYKSLLNEANLAIRKLAEPLGISIS